MPTKPEINAARTRFANMMHPQHVEEALHKHISVYLESTNMDTLDYLSTAIESIRDTENLNDSLALVCQAMIRAVSNVLAQNTRDLATLLNQQAAKK